MIHTGDCVEVMRTLPDASVDAVVTDPPYGLEFMGKDWDRLDWRDGGGFSMPGIGGATPWPSFSRETANPSCAICKRLRRGSKKCTCPEPEWRVKGKTMTDRTAERSKLMQAWHEQWATEALRVLKPGGYLLAFGGTRTVHRLASAIEDAGFEIRDDLVWIYASGFPKSLDVSKALDKVAGAEREVTGYRESLGYPDGGTAVERNRKGTKGSAIAIEVEAGGVPITAPATDLARQWQGWGTALKPAHEPIVMARKPLTGTVAQNVTRYGTGALNIDGTRIPGTPQTTHKNGNRQGTHAAPMDWGEATGHETPGAAARWPSNVLLSDPELFDQPNPYVVGSGATLSANPNSTRGERVVGEGWASRQGDENSWRGNGEAVGYTDSGGYSRFFIIPKADRAEREPVLRGQLDSFEGADPMAGHRGRRMAGDVKVRPDGKVSAARENLHPTVKPVDLMRHLVRLVTPPGGTVLDPFLGSGSTAIACELEGFPWIGIEKEPEYVAIAEARLNGTQRGLGLDTPLEQKRKPNTSHWPARRSPHKAEGWGFSSGQMDLEERTE